jgi:transglutaminase-like putative cysteine protease
MQNQRSSVKCAEEIGAHSELSACLSPTAFIDSDSPVVAGFAEDVCKRNGATSSKEKAISLYYAVRDEIYYDPYDLQYSPQALMASTVLTKGSGYCVAKAVVLAAVARQQGIPARLGFADVRNHLSTARLRDVMGTDLFIYHGYTELWLDNRWVKATPAFNLSLCQRFRVRPLEFDGEHDSIFHEYNDAGERHMEYVNDHGSYDDLPFEEIFAAYRRLYPRMFQEIAGTGASDFHREAMAERREK